MVHFQTNIRSDLAKGQKGLKVPQRQLKRRRLWLNDGSYVRLHPQHRDHVWSYDFVFCRTHDGRRLRMLTLTNEFTRERRV